LRTGFLDWTENKLDFYLFDRQGSKTTLLDSRSVQIEDKVDSSILKSVINKKTDELYLSVPMDSFTLRELQFPFSDKSKINNTISYELDGILLGSINDYIIDHIIIDTTDVETRVLAVCLEKSKLQEMISMFSELDMEPKVITSIDLRLSEGNTDKLFDEPVTDSELRATAAGQELLNPSINLRQHELSYQGDIERFIIKLRLTAILAIAAFSILSASSIFSIVNLNNEHDSLTKGMHDTYRATFPEDKKIIDIGRQFKGKLKVLTEKKAALGSLPVLDILHTIAMNKKEIITLYEFNADGKNLVIKGAAKSFEDVESLKNTLASLFKGVKVIESGTSSDNKIIFTILMQEKIA
jgi:type II secretory pathway component PulL